MGSFAGPVLPDGTRRRLDAGLGSIAVFGSNVASAAQLARLTGAIHAAGADVLVATDEEGGDVTRLHMGAGSPLPGNAALGAADDVSLTERVARSLGGTLREAGVDLDLAPVVDVNSNPHNPVIGVRSFGADAGLVSRHTGAYVSGLQAAGVGACVKHWPGHGDTAVDSHLDLPRVDLALDELRQREFLPFAAAVAAGAVAVMTSHVLVPALDPRLPATLSRPALTALRELGFDGLIVSDALDMRGASAGRGVPAAAVLALAAGCDLLCLGADKDDALTDAVVDGIVAAVQSGELGEERLADAAARVVATARELRRRQARPPVPTDAAAAGDAAVRALSVRGCFPALKDAVVLRVVTGTNIAVGEVPWGLPADAAVLGGRQRDVHESDDVSDVARPTGAPLVVLVREPHRHRWVGALLASLATSRPDLVVVEMGWPGPEPLPGAAVVTTHGASRVSGTALADLLARGSQR